MRSRVFIAGLMVLIGLGTALISFSKSPDSKPLSSKPVQSPSTPIPLLGGRNFAADDNSFMVTFPAGFTQVIKSSSVSGSDQGPIYHTSYLSPSPRGSCLIRVSDYPTLPPKAETFLQDVETEALNQRTLEADRAWEANGVYRKSFHFHHTQIEEYGQSLLVLKKKRLYMVTCTMRTCAERDRKKIQDFFLSFQLNALAKE